jgi:hypothetical protein
MRTELDTIRFNYRGYAITIYKLQAEHRYCAGARGKGLSWEQQTRTFTTALQAEECITQWVDNKLDS